MRTERKGPGSGETTLRSGVPVDVPGGGGRNDPRSRGARAGAFTVTGLSWTDNVR